MMYHTVLQALHIGAAQQPRQQYTTAAALQGLPLVTAAGGACLCKYICVCVRFVRHPKQPTLFFRIKITRAHQNSSSSGTTAANQTQQGHVRTSRNTTCAPPFQLVTPPVLQTKPHPEGEPCMYMYDETHFFAH